MSAVPKHRPILNSGVALATTQATILADKHADGAQILIDCAVYVLAVRYPAVGEYDDVIAAVHRDGREIVVVNGNTQPSHYGASPVAAGKLEARLQLGVWPYVKGHHRDLPHCFRQPDHDKARALKLERYFTDRRRLGEYTVDRVAKDGTVAAHETGTFATNLHPGGIYGTSSAGCQTAPEPQYGELRDTLYRWLDDATQAWLPYVLIDGPI